MKFIILLLLAGALSSTAFFFFPSVKEAELTSTLAISFFSTITLLGAVWYFLSSLKTFKPGLKAAYYLLSTGIVFYGFVLAQFIVVLFVDISESLALRNTMYLVPYGAASLFAFLGMRKFAQLLDLKAKEASLIPLLIIASVAAGLAMFLPVPAGLYETGVDETTLNLVLAVLVWCTVFGICAASLAWRVRQVISSKYKAAMTWTAAALTVMTFSALHELVIKIYFFDTDYVITDYASWAFILTGILFLGAGLAFKGDSRRRQLQLPENASPIDVVVAAAQLVSKPAAIDRQLDTLREITARSSSSGTLTEADRNDLTKLYLYLENYLVNKDPLVKLTREEMRDNLPKDFVDRL